MKNASNNPFNANNVFIKAETESQYVTVPELPLEVNTIEAETVYISENEIFVTLAENIPNNELIIIDLVVNCLYQGAEYEWVLPVKFHAIAPSINIQEIYIENSYGSRINQFAKNADNNLVVVFSNQGEVDLQTLNVAISSSSEYITIDNNSNTIESIEKGNNSTVKFLVKTGNAQEITPVSIVIRASSGAYIYNMVYTKSINAADECNMTNETKTTAYANFYDSGGKNSPYYSNEYLKYTFLPKNENKKLKISFSSFDLEKNDNLSIYNGSQALTSLLLATLTGSDLPQDYEATNGQGALTFVFRSNAEVQNAGWVAVVYEMENYHNVSFVITDENHNPVTDAIIKFDGYKLAKNQFNVSLVAAGEYSYSVEKEGYLPHIETITIENEDKELTIKLINSSIENNHLSDFYAYPNPFSDIINIGGNSSQFNKVYISNMLGQRIKEIELNGKSSFTTDNLPQGIYIVTFERKDRKIETVKMIKR